MKVFKFTCLVLLVAGLMSSCAKEDPYMEELNSSPDLQLNVKSASQLSSVLPSTVDNATQIDQYCGEVSGVPVAGVHYQHSTGSDTYINLSIADFSQFSTNLSNYSTGAGLVQGSSSNHESFSIDQESTNTGDWGFEMLQSSGLSAASVGTQFCPDDPTDETRLIHVSQSSNLKTGSYMTALQTTHADVSGWEIYDGGNGIAMLIVTIDGRYGYTLSATNQTDCSKLKSFLDNNFLTSLRAL